MLTKHLISETFITLLRPRARSWLRLQVLAFFSYRLIEDGRKIPLTKAWKYNLKKMSQKNVTAYINLGYCDLS